MGVVARRSRWGIAVPSVGDVLTTTAPRPLGLFLRRAVQAPGTVGAVVPSGRALVDALVAPVLERAGRPVAVLEVGAGTGPVTRRLVQELGAGDRLDVVECDPVFLPALHEVVAGARCAVRVHGCRVEDLPAGPRYDVVVSALPLTNFPVAGVRAVLDRFDDLLAPGGTLVRFGYLGSAAARVLVAGPAEVARHREVQRLLDGRGGSRRRVWANLPPAAVVRVQAPAGAR